MRRSALAMSFSILFFFVVQEIMAQKKNGHPAAKSEEALIVCIRLSDGSAGTHQERDKLFKLEDKLIAAIEGSSAGEFDGNEIGGGTFTMYMYGSSAARLWEVASPILKNFRAPVASYAVKRYGPPGAKEERISL